MTPYRSLKMKTQSNNPQLHSVWGHENNPWCRFQTITFKINITKCNYCQYCKVPLIFTADFYYCRCHVAQLFDSNARNSQPISPDHLYDVILSHSLEPTTKSVATMVQWNELRGKLGFILISSDNNKRIAGSRPQSFSCTWRFGQLPQIIPC